MNKTIEIIIAPNGQSRVETKGFVGSQCRVASQFIEQAIGQRTGEEFTSQFYQQQHQKDQLQEKT